MSYTQGLVVARPERLAKINAEFAAAEPTKTWIQDIFNRFDADFDDYWEESHEEDLQESDESRLAVFNEAFLVLVDEGYWSFDGSIELMLKDLAKGVPNLSKLHAFFAGRAFDVELPTAVSSAESGLVGLWSSAAVSEAAEVAFEYASPDSVNRFFGNKSYGLLQRLTGAPKKDQDLMQMWLADNYWPDWQKLPNALERAVREQFIVGLVDDY